MGKSLVNSVSGYPNLVAPLSHTLGLPVESNEFRATPISGLLLCCSPSDVANFISFFVVDSVQGFSLRAVSHVCVKSFKGEEFFAHSNSSPAIAGKHSMLRISASSNHLDPAKVTRSSRLSVRDSHGNQHLVTQASARPRTAATKRTSPDVYGIPALALAQPKDSCRMAFRGIQNGFKRSQSPETGTFNVELCHQYILSQQYWNSN
jgi:hypothetical protein